jgi:hypothetical protein
MIDETVIELRDIHGNRIEVYLNEIISKVDYFRNERWKQALKCISVKRR